MITYYWAAYNYYYSFHSSKKKNPYSIKLPKQMQEIVLVLNYRNKSKINLKTKHFCLRELNQLAHSNQAASHKALVQSLGSTRPNLWLPWQTWHCFSPFFSLVLPSAFFSVAGSSTLGTVRAGLEESFGFS